jgi:two-component system response regulator FlrC
MPDTPHRILVVDDEEGVRTFLAEALELDGHRVETAADGDEAVGLLEKRSYDLLLTDLRMPGGLDGMGLLRKVRAEQPELEVIVLTAFGSVETAVEAMKLGAHDYLQKPVSSLTELRLLVGRALEHRSLLASRERQSREEPPSLALTHGAPSMEPVVGALRKVARTNATVLLLGESGTGKEVAARQVHAWSDRAGGPFVAVNCAALAETLLESELFGHEKGAFTGAVSTRRGRIELARGGSFFLDEIGELKPALQVKLLRVLQERRFERVGGARSIECDVRWIAATNRGLPTMIEEGQFREDLYHRLAVFPVELPPLRERREDILPLCRTLLERIGSELGRIGLSLAPDVAPVLEQHDWRGNIRALANALERAAILAEGTVIEREHLALASRISGQRTVTPRSGGASRTLAEQEREAIEQALAAVGGNRRKAAERLGIGVRTLYEKLKRYDIE